MRSKLLWLLPWFLRRTFAFLVPSIGTRSVLIGAHCFFLHPWFVLAGWTKLYGFPLDPRLYLVFFLHDLGYVGKPNLDGEEGERHPEFAASLMLIFGTYWHNLCLYHSRYYAKKHSHHPSKLCFADKLAITFEPWWLYLPRCWLTGELDEYMMRAHGRVKNNEAVNQEERAGLTSTSPYRWYTQMQAYIRRWVEQHRYGAVDTWTAGPSIQTPAGLRCTHCDEPITNGGWYRDKSVVTCLKCAQQGKHIPELY